MHNWELITRQAQALLDRACRNGEECGCQLAIYYDGEPVVDIASGNTLPDGSGEPVSKDALFPLFSCGKAVLATAVLQSIDRGVFALETPVAEFWDEFRTPEKSAVTVEHILSHRAGMYILPKVSSYDELADWELMSRRTAALIPRNAPGKRCCYHPLTFGWLAGNLLVLTEKRPLDEIIRERILIPCGIENELFFGTDPAADRRFVPVDDSAMPESPSWYATMMHNPLLRHSCIPSFNACGSARAMARFYAALAGTLPDVELLTPRTRELATATAYRDPDDKGNANYLFGLGMILAGPMYAPARIYGHGGAAGAEGFFDRDLRWAVGFTKNRPLPTHPKHPVRIALSEILNLPVRNW